MRKVVLNMKEEVKYLSIKKVAEGKMHKNRAAVHLGITRRQVDRLLIKYKELGKKHSYTAIKPKSLNTLYPLKLGNKLLNSIAINTSALISHISPNYSLQITILS